MFTIYKTTRSLLESRMDPIYLQGRHIHFWCDYSPFLGLLVVTILVSDHLHVSNDAYSVNVVYVKCSIMILVRVKLTYSGVPTYEKSNLVGSHSQMYTFFN